MLLGTNAGFLNPYPINRHCTIASPVHQEDDALFPPNGGALHEGYTSTYEETLKTSSFAAAKHLFATIQSDVTISQIKFCLIEDRAEWIITGNCG